MFYNIEITADPLHCHKTDLAMSGIFENDFNSHEDFLSGIKRSYEPNDFHGLVVFGGEIPEWMTEQQWNDFGKDVFTNAQVNKLKPILHTKTVNPIIGNAGCDFL